MPARIISKINGSSPATGESRDDLRSGNTVSVEHDTAAFPVFTSISWSLEYVPQDPDQNPSTAVLSGTTGPGPHTFIVDNEGSYLVKETVDGALPSLSVQYVRLRALTKFGRLSLIAAGERRDTQAIIPVDVSTEGWAHEQNFNINTLLGLVSHVSSSGRIIYVDSNRGIDYSKLPNDFVNNGGVEDFADFSTVQEAIDKAVDPSPTNPFTGGVVPSADNPVIIAVRPGFYIEDLNLQSFVHVYALPTTGGFLGDDALDHVGDKTVVIQNANTGGIGTHTVTTTAASDFVIVKGIHFVNIGVTTNAVFRKVGEGGAYFSNCRIMQLVSGPSQGACYSAEVGHSRLDNCVLIQKSTTDNTNVALALAPSSGNSANLIATNCVIEGTSGVILNTNRETVATATLIDCKITQVGTGAGSFCVDTWASFARLVRCELFLSNGTTEAFRSNPDTLGKVGDLTSIFEFSNTAHKLSIDGTNVVGTATLTTCASEYSAIIEAGAVTVNACVQASSLFYADGGSGTTVQAALDQSLAFGTSITNLDDAYDGYDFSGAVPVRLVGAGKRIIGDQGAVEITQGGDPVGDPILPEDGSNNGGIKAVGSIQLGAFGAAEIIASPNFYGTGPVIRGGQTVWPNGAIQGGDFLIVANAVPDPTFLNYDLSLQTMSTVGNSTASSVGRVLLKAGDSLGGSGAQAPDGGHVYVEAGCVLETVAGTPGDVWLVPGQAALGPTSGTVKLVDPSTGTAATLTVGAAIGGGAVGVSGVLTFSTQGSFVTVSIVNTETIADIVTKITTAIEDYPGIGTASDVGGGQLRIESAAKGPNAKIYFVQDDQTGALNTALGDFSVPTAAFVAGTFPDVVDIYASGDQEITIGNGVNDMVYNAVTGKLTIPGIIDPTGMVFDQIGETSIVTGAGKGGIFVSDGTGGAAAAGNIWYKNPAGTLTDLTAAGGGGAPTGSPYILAAADGTLTGSRVLEGTAGEVTVADGGGGGNFTLALADSGPGSGGPFTNATVSVDAKGRITAVTQGSTAATEHQYRHSILIPLNAGANSVSSYETVAFAGGLTTGNSIKVFFSEAISSASPVNLTIEVGTPGSLSSYLSAQDLTAVGVPAGGAVQSYGVTGGALTTDQIVKITVTSTVDITAGGGLYVTFTGIG